ELPLERHRRRVRRRAVGTAVGVLELRAVSQPHDLALGHGTVRRAGRHTPSRGAGTGLPELHTDLSDFGPAHGTARAGPVQRRKLTNRLQLSAGRACLDVQPAAELFRSTAIPGGGETTVLTVASIEGQSIN